MHARAMSHTVVGEGPGEPLGAHFFTCGTWYSY